MSSNSDNSFVSGNAERRENEGLNRRYEGIRRGLRSLLVKYEALALKRPLFFAISLVTVLFAAVIWAVPPAYQTNDDAIMNMIAAGQVISLEPDEHLFCTNIIIGKLLKSLYVRYPDMLWYGWYLVATQWVATIALLYCFLQPNYTRLRVLYFLVYFSTVGTLFIVNLQFTTTATLSGFAGVMLLLQLLRTPCGQGLRKLVVCAVAGLLLIWGGMIRSETFMLTLLLACPAFLAVYWIGNASRRTGMAVCCVLGLATCCLFLANKYDQEAYREPAWQSFYKYAHSYFVKMFDMKMIEHTPETKYVFDQVGWSENDAKMMFYSFYYDDPIYDDQILNSILTSHPWVQERKYGELLWETMGNVFGHRTTQSLICCLPFFLLLFDRSKRKHWPCTAAFITAVAILPALMFLRKAPPERVFVPVLAFPWLILLSSLALQCSDTSRRISRITQSLKTAWQYENWSLKTPGWRKHLLLRTFTLLLIIGFSANMLKLYGKSKRNTRNLAEYGEILADLRTWTTDSDRIVVAFIRNFPLEYHPPLYNSSDYKGLRIFCTCWFQRSPVAERMKKHLNITTLGKTLAEKQDILLILDEKTRDILLRYLAEHYKNTFQVVELKDYPQGSLSKLEPLQGFRDNQGKDSAALSATPILKPKKLRK